MKYLKQSLLSILGLLLAFVSLNCKEEIKPMLLKGQIINPQSDYVLVIKGNQSDSLKLDNNGRFEYKPSESNERFVSMMLERNLLNIIYLKPGSEVFLEANGEKLKKRNINNITFSGIGSEESNFLLELEKQNRDRNHKYNSSKLNLMKAPDFEVAYHAKLNELSTKYNEFLKDNPNASKSFIEDLKILNDIERKRSFTMYPRMYKMFAKDTIPQNYTFKDYNYNIPLDNANLYKYHLTYSTFVDRHFKEAFESRYPMDSEYSIAMDTFLDFYKNNTIPEVAERNINKLMYSYINYPAESRGILKTRYKEFVKDSLYLVNIEKRIKQTERLEKGQPAPEIAYPDKDGNMVSTKDFLGKIIYIDLWATWCAPCKEEIPFLEKMSASFKDRNDIVFMSVAIKDNEKRWRKMLKDKHMTGIQLYSGNTMNEKINRDYVVNTIPRFLIIGKDGNIIDAFATRPSDPETKTRLEALVSN